MQFPAASLVRVLWPRKTLAATEQPPGIAALWRVLWTCLTLPIIGLGLKIPVGSLAGALQVGFVENT